MLELSTSEGGFAAVQGKRIRRQQLQTDAQTSVFWQWRHKNERPVVVPNLMYDPSDWMGRLHPSDVCAHAIARTKLFRHMPVETGNPSVRYDRRRIRSRSRSPSAIARGMGERGGDQQRAILRASVEKAFPCGRSLPISSEMWVPSTSSWSWTRKRWGRRGGIRFPRRT